MSISQNFPAIQPTLNLNFARSKKLDPRITFTRASSATRMNAQGLIEVVSADTPRFEHSYNSTTGSVNSLGLLIEESRSNLLTYSEDFTNSAWTLFGTTSRTANTVTAPDGNTTADTIVVPNSSGMYQFFSTSAGITYTFSVWLRTPSSPQDILIVLNTNLGDPVEKTITVTSTWQRFSVTKTTAVGSTLISSQLSQGSGGTFYVWGAQTEVGAFPTSYIPTVASTVTRSADNASITGANFTGWYNQSEGTLFASIRNQTIRSSITYDRLVALCGTNVDTDGIAIYTQTASGGGAQNKFLFAIAASGTETADFNVAGPDNVGKAILAYKTNDAAGTVSGIIPATDTSVTLPTCVSLQICSAVRYQSKPTATIQQIIYYPKRLTNAQLQNLTK